MIWWVMVGIYIIFDIYLYIFPEMSTCLNVIKTALKEYSSSIKT